MTVEIREEDGTPLPDGAIGKLWCKGPSVMVGYFRDQEATDACMVDGWLDTGDMAYMSDGYIYIVGRAKDMIIVNGKNHWPQDIEWAVEQLPGFKSGDIAAFAITTPGGEETPLSSSSAAAATMPSGCACATKSASASGRSPA